MICPPEWDTMCPLSAARGRPSGKVDVTQITQATRDHLVLSTNGESAVVMPGGASYNGASPVQDVYSRRTLAPQWFNKTSNAPSPNPAGFSNSVGCSSALGADCFA